MNVKIPDLSLVVLIGTSGSGKSTFARKQFLPTETVSSDQCRALISDNENDLTVTKEAFELVHYMIAKRLKLGKFTVVDATNVQSSARKPLVDLAKQFHVLPVAIVFKVPESVCKARNEMRTDRNMGGHVIRNQNRDLLQSIKSLKREGFRHIFVLDSVEQIDAVTITRTPLWNDRRSDHGPFDIIGDVHGCLEELLELLHQLGYTITDSELSAPQGRKAVFLGDLVDRGPASPQVVLLVKRMVEAGLAIAVPGNHDSKLVKKLSGRDVNIGHGLEQTLEQLSHETPEVHQEIREFLDSLVSHYVLDGGKLVVAHAGMREDMQGRGSGAVREFALYGETTGETDEFGLPVRVKWAEEYRGSAMVVYGHTPVPEPEFLNNTVCIDTGCVFGGKLTALRYPEMEFVSVEAKETYCEPVRPVVNPEVSEEIGTAQQANDSLLDIADVRGRQHVFCDGFGTVIIPEENAAAAMEIMSRFGADPRWLVYLPPTMSPAETSDLPDYLEHPAEVLSYFRKQGVTHVVAEEKHMGSRSVVVVGKDAEAIQRKFGVDGGLGVILSRSGRRFFEDFALEQALLARLSSAMDRGGFWSALQTDWAVLDTELMPWNAKAQQLIQSQYAPVSESAEASLTARRNWIAGAAGRLPDVDLAELRTKTDVQLEAARLFKEAFSRYCWPVEKLEDYKLAPFHILATEGAVHFDKNHEWHMQTISAFCAEDPEVLRATPWRKIDLSSPEECESLTGWWITHTNVGGEGMVIKPLDFIHKGKNGMIQPALKCRGREYLRIIYGPDYLLPENLERLRKRGLSKKRSLALREFSLGLEGLRRFVAGQPLRKVHQCAFGVLALESEPVDPRL